LMLRLRCRRRARARGICRGNFVEDDAIVEKSFERERERERETGTEVWALWIRFGLGGLIALRDERRAAWERERS
jgi:hypothetical protein